MPEFTMGTIEDVIAELEVEFSEIKELTPSTADLTEFGLTSGCTTNNCTGPDCQTF